MPLDKCKNANCNFYFFTIIWMNLFIHKVLVSESASVLNVGYALPEEPVVIQTRRGLEDKRASLGGLSLPIFNICIAIR